MTSWCVLMRVCVCVQRGSEERFSPFACPLPLISLFFFFPSSTRGNVRLLCSPCTHRTEPGVCHFCSRLHNRANEHSLRNYRWRDWYREGTEWNIERFIHSNIHCLIDCNASASVCDCSMIGNTPLTLRMKWSDVRTSQNRWNGSEVKVYKQKLAEKNTFDMAEQSRVR